MPRLERRAPFEITRVEGKRQLSQPCTARLAPTIGISQYEGYPGTERNLREDSTKRVRLAALLLTLPLGVALARHRVGGRL